MKIPTVAWNSYRSVLSIAVFGFLLYQALFWVGDVSSASVQAEGLFTTAQAARGADAYAKNCASCHGQSLEGTTSKPLAGARFMRKWGDGGNTIDDLLFVIRTQMPYEAAGTLTNQQYIDILAFILKSNGYGAGSKELTVDSPSLDSKIAPQNESAKPAVASKVELPAQPKETVNAAPRTANGKPSQSDLNSAAASTTDWLMSNHDYGGQRFVDLKQINRQNVVSLKPVAMYQAADMNPFHSNPVVSGGLMYITIRDSTIALDASTLKLKWRYDRRPKGKEGWPMNRGVAIKDGLVVRGTLDGYLVALDAATGKLVWDRALVEMDKHEGGFTMAP